MISELPDPPYFAVYFISHRRPDDGRGYGEMAIAMAELAARQPGYLGMESLRDENGWGVTVSYWESLEAIRRWKRHPEHLEAQRRGQAEWYDAYTVRICRVERAYGAP